MGEVMHVYKEGTWEISVPSQFCCGPKIVVKHKGLVNKKTKTRTKQKKISKKGEKRDTKC